MKLAPDPNHDVLIVIPTVCDPDVLIPTVERIVSHIEEHRVALMLSINAPTEDHKRAAQAMAACERICHGKVTLMFHREKEPIGFGAANNRGFTSAYVELGGLPDLTIFHNDDAHVTAGWLTKMLDGLHPAHVHGYSDPWNPNDPNSLRPDRDALAYGSIGIIGPMSNLVAGIQQVTSVATPSGNAQFQGDVDHFAQVVEARYKGQRVTASFLSGFCVGFSRSCLTDLLLVTEKKRGLVPIKPDMQIPIKRVKGNTDFVMSTYGEVVGPWDEDTYRIAGYEDNDICVRAEISGWRLLAVADCFVGHIGHQTFDRLFPDAQRGMRNRLAHYRKWQWYTNPTVDLHLGAVCRVRFDVANDIHMMRHALLATGRVSDSISILLTNNPLDVRDDIAWDREKEKLHSDDLEFVKLCSDKSPELVAEMLRGWAATILAGDSKCRLGSTPREIIPRLCTEIWVDPFNERDERNRTAEMAEDMGADWIFSFDSDEVIENRVTREHFDRWMRHPDPGVMSYDQSWVNHWDTGRLAREDRPWGDGGTYEGGMHGFRLWRVAKMPGSPTRDPRRIIAGNPPLFLHCGNSPDHDVMAKRVSGLRFRHYGYVRYSDRIRKHSRYHEQDPNADPSLTGNASGDPYGHLVAEEGMKLTPFNPHNGIGLHMLLYEKESADDLARVLDQVGPVVDKIVLVWTGKWSKKDQRWLGGPEKEDEAIRVQQDDAFTKWKAVVAQAPEGAQLPPRPHTVRSARAAKSLPSHAARKRWPSTGPSFEMASIAAMFGASWVHQPLDDNLGQARNAGLEALLPNSREKGIGWSIFFDLDEHFPGGFRDLVALRRMAEAVDAKGWMLKFTNFHADQQPSMSQSIRMVRLLPQMKFSGRVHETFDAALEAIHASGDDVSVRVSPFQMHHYGLAKDRKGMMEKLQRYQRLLELELLDNPHNSGAWVALSLHFRNDGRDEKALECLERAVLCAGRGYLPFRELSLHHLRIGKVLLAEALDRCSPGLAFHKQSLPLLRALDQLVHPQPLLGRGPDGANTPTCPDIELPPFSLPQTFEGLGAAQATQDEAPQVQEAADPAAK